MRLPFCITSSILEISHGYRPSRTTVGGYRNRGRDRATAAHFCRRPHTRLRYGSLGAVALSDLEDRLGALDQRHDRWGDGAYWSGVSVGRYSQLHSGGNSGADHPACPNAGDYRYPRLHAQSDLPRDVPCLRGDRSHRPEPVDPQPDAAAGSHDPLRRCETRGGVLGAAVRRSIPRLQEPRSPLALALEWRRCAVSESRTAQSWSDGEKV